MIIYGSQSEIITISLSITKARSTMYSILHVFKYYIYMQQLRRTVGIFTNRPTIYIYTVGTLISPVVLLDFDGTIYPALLQDMRLFEIQTFPFRYPHLPCAYTRPALI